MINLKNILVINNNNKISIITKLILINKNNVYFKEFIN